MAKPDRIAAIAALKEIQRIFKSSKISEKEMLASGRRIRRELVAKQYGKLD